VNFIEKTTFHDVILFKLGSSYFGTPKMNVFSFLIDGVLIDTGHPKIGKYFTETLKDESIEKVIVTHHHEDHSGNIEKIKKSKNIPVYASPLCCQLIQHPKRIEPARVMAWGQPKKASAIPLDLKKDIQTNNYKFRIFETPGHAIDQISLYEESKGWLFSGDIFINDYIRIFMRDEDIAQQINSIRRLLKLEFDVLFCNHQPVLKNGKTRLAKKLDFLETYYDSVKREHEKGNNPKQIMTALNLKEQHLTKFISLGQLSQLNMIRSVVRSLKI